MKKKGLILGGGLLLLLAAIGVVWLLALSRHPRLTFKGFRHSSTDDRWYADLQLVNRSRNGLHFDGYLSASAAGTQTNASMLDFQCTVYFNDKQVETWPLWFATWLDLKPGENAEISLHIDPLHPPRRLALTYAPIPPRPDQITRALDKAQSFLRRYLKIKRKRPAFPPGPQLLWCPTEMEFPQTTGKTNSGN